MTFSPVFHEVSQPGQELNLAFKVLAESCGFKNGGKAWNVLIKDFFSLSTHFLRGVPLSFKEKKDNLQVSRVALRHLILLSDKRYYMEHFQPGSQYRDTGILCWLKHPSCFQKGMGLIAVGSFSILTTS